MLVSTAPLKMSKVMFLTISLKSKKKMMIEIFTVLQYYYWLNLRPRSLFTILTCYLLYLKASPGIKICDVALRKGGGFAYDDNFEFIIHSVRTFFKL